MTNHPAVVLAALAVALPAQAATLYVNASTGVNAGTCTVQASPCKTVTYAMTQAATGSPGDTIHVAPGSYDTALGEVFPIVVKSGVQLRSTGSALNTILDASGANKRVLELTNTNSSTLVEGFTITGGVVEGSTALSVGGGLSIDGGAPRIRRNVILNNAVRGAPGADSGGGFATDGGEARGGGIHVTGAAPIVENNVFRGNIARGGSGYFSGIGAYTAGGPGRGGALYFQGTGGSIVNNTFYQNQAAGGGGGMRLHSPWPSAPGGTASHGAVHANGPTVNNNLFANNSAVGGSCCTTPFNSTPTVATATFGAIEATNPPAPVSNNLFYNNSVNGAAGTGDTIGTNSRCYNTACATGFHGEPSNLRITPTSPAAGNGTATGAPTDDLAGTVRPGTPSIGAYEPTAATDPPRAVNISTRAQVLTGDDVLIGGFIIAGSTPKTVVVRARGPSMTGQGVQGVLADPFLQLFSGPTVIAANDDWQQASNVALVQSSGFAPSNEKESAILITLNPGAYTAILSGAGGTTGIGIVEVFEVDAITTPLMNIATRGRVQTGDNVMIAGFIIQGDGPQSVVVRARGPSLQFQVQGSLANPTLQLYSGSTVIAQNDDWQQAANTAQIRTTGFAPFYDAESAILITLNPGAYTAIVSGVGNTSGVAIVEVFKN